MAAKQFQFGEDAREKILAGMKIVNDSVSTTLSPKGRNVALDKKSDYPQVIHDGVTIAREIELDDPFENMGAQIIKEAAGRTNDLSGDGTTQSTILCYAIAKAAFKAIQSGANPMVLRRGIEKATKELVKELVSKSTKITTYKQKLDVATISAQDKDLGKLIADGLEKIGKDGVIAVEESQSLETNIEYREGMQYDRGWASPYFVTNQNRMEALIEEPYILVTDMKIEKQEDALMILEKCLYHKIKNLVIIADYVESEALGTFVVNGQNAKRNFNMLVTNAPGFGDRKREQLEDIAALTGATIISQEVGKDLTSIDLSDFGKAGKIISDRNNTLVVDGKGKKSEIKKRIKTLQTQLDETAAQFDKEKLQERLAKLISGVAIIKVGALTIVEMREKRERVIDAIGATRSATEEGIVPGGQVALLKVSSVLNTIEVTGDERIGVEIIRDAIEIPFKKLMENAGLSEEYKISDITKSKFTIGVDVEDGKVKDLVKAGIIDPVKVTRYALLNAVSSAIMALTTHVLVSDKQTKEKVEA